MGGLVCAVDVGTRSARAGIFDGAGRLLGRAEQPILLHEPGHGHAEHESEDIWRAVCAAVREARTRAGAGAAAVSGIAFDATCSLVVRDGDGHPLSVSTGGEANRDTVVWMDHRALAEAAECTATGHRVLGFAGGVMSPEMQVPKLMWLKRHLPRVWSNVGHLFDLTDFLSWKACGSLARSQCTLACKWTFLAHEEPGWQADFLAEVGLSDLLARGRLPERAAPVGADLGLLTPEAADALGLLQDCRVAAGLIDAYAGALGIFGGHVMDHGGIGRHMALIAGTSSCVMAMSPEPRAFPGFWGPYFGSTLPGYWMTEGGQSATGALLDHIIRLHGGGEPTASHHQAIAARIEQLRAAEGADFGRRLHVLPDFHGNRSPLADPAALGVISGLTLDSSFDALCALYWRTSVAIALGVRHILDRLNEQGCAIDTLHVTGGHTKNRLLMDLYSDATGCTVVEPVVDESVLLGTAMVAACGAGLYPTLADACGAMRQEARQRKPHPEARSALDRDYRVFLEMHRQRQALDTLV